MMCQIGGAGAMKGHMIAEAQLAGTYQKGR